MASGCNSGRRDAERLLCAQWALGEMGEEVRAVSDERRKFLADAILEALNGRRYSDQGIDFDFSDRTVVAGDVDTWEAMMSVFAMLGLDFTVDGPDADWNYYLHIK